MKPLKIGTYETVEGRKYKTPKEMWGFRTDRSSKKPEARAREFLEAHADVFRVPKSLRGIRHQKTIESLGAYHVIFQQWYRGRRVHRAYMTVHMDKTGRIYLAKNRVLPKKHLPTEAFKVSKARAVAAARASLPKKPGPSPKGQKKRDRPSRLHGTEERWYPLDDSAVPALRVRLTRADPTETWVVYVDATDYEVIDKYDNLARSVTGRATVFDPNPVTALGTHKGLIRSERRQSTNPIPEAAYTWVTLQGLRGNGRLEGVRVTTSATPARHRVSRKHHVYELVSGDRGFEEVMVYYHVDAAIRHLEDLGYTGRMRIFKKPLRVNVNGSFDDNSWYDAWSRIITFGTGYIDDAEDGEIIVHELGHALQNAIVPNWGASDEAAAMGEGFGDYFAASFFHDRKPPEYRRTMMSWNGLFDGLYYRRREKSKRKRARMWPPAQRYLDEPLNYRDDYKDEYDPHDSGVVWAVTLWDIFKAVGRDVADRIIIDSHFQLDPYTTMARGARAIMNADVNLYRGRHLAALEAVFDKRKIKWREERKEPS